MSLDHTDKDVQLVAKALEIAIDHLEIAQKATLTAYGWHTAEPISDLRRKMRDLQKRHFPQQINE